MKPLHWAVLAALLAVAAILWLLGQEDSDRRTQRPAGTVSESSHAPSTEDADTTGETDELAGFELLARILAPDGAPAGGTQIELCGREERLGAAGPDGAVRIGPLAPGFYSLIARSGEATASAAFRLDADLDLGDLRLARSVTISGRVLDPRGAPVAGARVEAVVSERMAGIDLTAIARRFTVPEEVAARTASDEDGRYLLPVPSGGRFALRAIAPGYAQADEAARAYPSDTEGIDLYLEPGSALAGRVVDPEGVPVAEARVMVVDVMSVVSDASAKAETRTDPRGLFALEVVPSLQLLLVVRAEGFAVHTRSNLMPPELDLTVILEPGASLRLRTVDAEQPGMPAPGVSVLISYRGSLAGGTTDERGELVVSRLPTRSTGAGLGNQTQAFLWGAGYVMRDFDLGSAQPQEGWIDAGDIPMERGGVVHGRVLDEATGEPVAGARVQSYGGVPQRVSFLNAGTAMSDEAGRYRLTGVPLEASVVGASHPDYVASVDPRFFLTGAASDEPIFPAGSRELEYDIRLTPAASVTGVVLEPEGRPAPGARVSLAEGANPLLVIVRGGPPVAHADAEGRFVLAGFKPDEVVRLQAAHREYGPSGPVQARAGSAEPVALRLTEPVSIGGRAVDEQGKPVAGARVTATAVQQQQPPGFPGLQPDAGPTPRATTDDQGRFLIRNAPRGELVLRLDHDGYLPLSRSLSSGSGASLDANTLVLERGPGIEGVVVDTEGEPLADVQVMASVSAAAGGVRAAGQGRAWARARTDAKGRFALHGLGDTEYELRLATEGYGAPTVTARAGGAPVRIVASEAAVLLGRVTSAGVPVSGANVAAMPTEAGEDDWSKRIGWARTGVDGTFRMENLPGGMVLALVVEHPGHHRKVVRGVAVSEALVEIALDAGLQVRGVVVDKEGRGVEGANVWVVAAGGNKMVRTDGQGRFVAGGLAPGRVTLHLRESGRGFLGREPIETEAGAEGVRIVALRGEAIEGRLVPVGSTDVRRLHVEALDANGNAVGSSWAWEEPRFAMRALEPGRYTIRVSRPREGDLPQVLALVPDVPTGTLDLRIEIRE